MPSDRDDAPSTRRRLRQEGKARQQASPRIVDPRIGSLRPDYGRQLRYRPPGGADKPWTPIWILRLRYSRLGELVLAPVQAFLARIGINRLMRGIFDVVIIIMSEFYAPF